MSASTFQFDANLRRYRILEQIGAGGGGMVFRAYDEELQRDVALKFLYVKSDDHEASRALLREAQIVASLNHPNICTVFEVREESGQAFMAMEHVAGQSLSSLIEKGPLPFESVLDFGMQMADALAYAHDHGVIHRDFKSSNVAVTLESRLKVLDFGLARREVFSSPESETQTTADETPIQGTLHYASPEVLRRLNPDSRSDIWALGVVLYQMAAARLPFCGSTVLEVASAILRDSPDMTPIRSPGLAIIIGRCLKKNPAQRYQRASEVFAALQMLASGRRMDVADALIKEHPMEGQQRRWFATRAWQIGLLFLIAACLIIYALWLRPIPNAKFESIAVLPLSNLSGDTEKDYLVDGMTDILITNLAKIRAFKRVISRTSILRYKEQPDKISLRDVARELNVDVILTGTVIQQKDRVRITLQLNDPKADRLVWAQDFEGNLADLINLEGNIAVDVAQQVKLTLTPEERRNLSGPSHPTSASIAYLKGRYYWDKRDMADLEKSKRYFEQAIEEDPGYALAYAGLADYYSVLTNEGIHEATKARAAAAKALELDPDLAEPHATLGLVALMDGYNSQHAETELKQAIAMNPNYATAHQWYAMVLTFNGRIQEALVEARRAQELDPLSMLINSYLGYCLYLSRQYSEAHSQFDKTLELDPNFAISHYFYARLLIAEKSWDQAILHAEKAATLAPEIPAIKATTAYAYAAAGQEQKARDVLREFGTNKRISAEAAFSYARLHEPATAVSILQEAENQGMLWSVSLPSEPAFDPIRTDPRFVTLRSRITGK